MRQRSFNFEPVKSKQCPHRCLVDKDGQPIHEYGYYVRLRTDTAWKVPVLHGKCPTVPDASSSAREEGMYGVFLMLLFRPHRGVQELVERLVRTGGSLATEDEAWTRVYSAYQHWRRFEMEEVARSCLEESARAGGVEPWVARAPNEPTPNVMYAASGERPVPLRWCRILGSATSVCTHVPRCLASMTSAQ